jgi:hypothetical protein
MNCIDPFTSFLSAFLPVFEIPPHTHVGRPEKIQMWLKIGQGSYNMPPKEFEKRNPFRESKGKNYDQISLANLFVFHPGRHRVHRPTMRARHGVSVPRALE